MLRFIGKLGLLVCAFWLLTGPLALLQIGAWSWMLVDYTQEDSFEQAIRDTFGGERPCGMCRAIASTQETLPEQAPAVVEGETKPFKLMLGLTRDPVIGMPGSDYRHPSALETTPPARVGSVPTPPPRAG